MRAQVRQLSLYERWPTRSDTEKWHVVKLSVFYLINSFLVPVLAIYLSGNKTTWYAYVRHSCSSRLLARADDN